MIIPVYFSPGTDPGLIRRLLVITLQDTPAYLPWEQVWLVIDGDPQTAPVLQELRAELGPFHIVCEPVNHGKLWVVRRGMQAALNQPLLDYFVTRDCDGDHSAADLPALVRAADLVKQMVGHTRLLVLGARRSRQRPMGWVRGQLELLLDQISLDALQYHLAQQQRTLNLSLCAQLDGLDLNSGYKVYGRELAQRLFVESEPDLAGITAADYWHYGPETCPVVEALLGDTILAEVPRLTWDGQPTTSFGNFEPTRLYGCMLTWLFTRLQIPLGVGAQWFDNHTAGLSLRLTSEGQLILGKLRSYTLGQVAAWYGNLEAPPPPSFTLPFI
jgi:hypothetical protein